jgi:hypothetical protein
MDPTAHMIALLPFGFETSVKAICGTDAAPVFLVLLFGLTVE